MVQKASKNFTVSFSIIPVGATVATANCFSNLPVLVLLVGPDHRKKLMIQWHRYNHCEPGKPSYVVFEFVVIQSVPGYFLQARVVTF